MSIEIVRSPIDQNDLRRHAELFDGEIVKVVVDLTRMILAIGGEYHADEEAVLLDDGSKQSDLWGANVLFGQNNQDRIEYDSMINIRPRIGNRSRLIQDLAIRTRVKEIIDQLIPV